MLCSSIGHIPEALEIAIFVIVFLILIFLIVVGIWFLCKVKQIEEEIEVGQQSEKSLKGKDGVTGRKSDFLFPIEQVQLDDKN